MRKQDMSPEFIRNIFIGFNDGLVSTLGAVSGFFAAFHNPTIVFAATLIEATAGALSMTAGAYVAVDSESESRNLLRKETGAIEKSPTSSRPFGAALTVGISYLTGAVVTAFPLILGARTCVPSWITAGLTIMVVSYFVAALSGMEIKRRVIVNVCILTVTAGITYGLGEIVQRFFIVR
jgi:VIT1/CCC1 family predicted Fe2+/Mn2+ transporter